MGLGVSFVGLSACLLGVWLVWCFGLTCFRRLFALRCFVIIWFTAAVGICDAILLVGWGFATCLLLCFGLLGLFGDWRWVFLWFRLVGCLLGFAGVWVLWRLWLFVLGDLYGVVQVWFWVWPGGLLPVVGFGCVGLFLGGFGGLVVFGVVCSWVIWWFSVWCD